MKGERGQALVIAAVLIGIGALAIVGLRVVQDRVLANALAQDAGEAAVEAAAAAVADAYVARLGAVRARAFDVPAPEIDVAGLLADPATRVLTYCEFGKISTLAAATLRQMGFASAIALDGGFRDWVEAGAPVAT